MRNQVSQIIGYVALALIAVGASLYAINSLERTLMRGLLIAGGAAFVAFVVLNHDVIRSFARKRSSRYGANMIVMILLVTTIIIIVQAIAARHSYRYDLTRNKRFSLAPQTFKVLASLDKTLELYAFYQQGTETRERAVELINQYAHVAPLIHYEFIDPDRSPRRAGEMEVTRYGTVVLALGNKRERILGISEERLTNAIVKLTRGTAKVLYFPRGHAEKDPFDKNPPGYSTVRKAIENENYDVRALSLFEESEIPEDCVVLVCAGPKNDYFESEIDKIRDYLSRGGNAMFMLDPRFDLPNIQNLLSEFNVRVANDVIIDPYSHVSGGEYTVPVVNQYARHPITKDFGVATVFPMARSVHAARDGMEGVTIRDLAQTGKSAWGEMDLDGVRRGQAAQDDADVPAPVTVAAIAVKQFETDDGTRYESQMVVIGDSDFADNSTVGSAGNRDFFLNIINFLAEEKDLIAIRAKKGPGDVLFLTATQGRLIFLLSVVLLPLSVIGVGGTVYARRRKRG